jgi:FkbM family methyltransferase
VIDVDLEEMARFLPQAPVIVEAGAFDGTDTEKLATFWPQSKVHAFEPLEREYGLLASRTRGLSNVFTYQVALGEHTGSATMFRDTTDPHATGHVGGSSSLLKPSLENEIQFPELRFDDLVEVPVTTLDDWAKQGGLSHCDLLWLDLQGMELGVLKASPRFLEFTSCVYLEVSQVKLYEGSPLYRQVRAWMEAEGFVVQIERVARVMGNVFFARDKSTRASQL